MSQEKNEFQFDDVDHDEDITPEESSSGTFKNEKDPFQNTPIGEPFQSSSKAETNNPKKNAPLFEFGDVPGGIRVGVEQRVSRFAVEKIKFNPAYKSLIGIVSDEKIAVKMHYVQGAGSFICQECECCEVLGPPRIRYAIPIVEYDTNRDGRPISAELNHKVFVATDDHFQDLSAINRRYGISQMDILVICKDEQFQKLSFHVDDHSRWRKSEAAMSAIKDFWKRNQRNILSPVARNISRERLLEILRLDNSDTSDIDGVDDVFGDKSPF